MYHPCNPPRWHIRTYTQLWHCRKHVCQYCDVVIASLCYRPTYDSGIDILSADGFDLFFWKNFSILTPCFFLLTIILFYKWEKLQLTKSAKAISMPLIALLLIGVLWFLAVLWVSSDNQSFKIINIATIVFSSITIITFIAVEINKGNRILSITWLSMLRL